MGAGVAAAHVILFVALASVGTVLIGSATDTWRETSQAQAEAIHRVNHAANERITLLSDGFLPVRCVDDNPPAGCQGTVVDSRTWANFTNEGSRAIPLDEVVVLVNGTYTDTSSLAVFQVRETPSSNLWIPGEVLEVRVDGQGDADVTVAGPHGTTAHRRA